MESLIINGRSVGPGHPPYVIAEIGSNHNGDLALCKELIFAAKESGADAAKFQSWTDKSLISAAEYARNTVYSDTKKHFGTLKQMVTSYQMTEEMHQEAAAYCAEIGIDFMSSAFSPTEVDLLVQLGAAAIKLASMDVNHPLLLQHAAASPLPVILSTGMATLDEIAVAAQTMQGVRETPFALLHCVSIYPPEPEALNLRNIPMLAAAFECPIGYSDHTIGVAMPLAAIALGACIIEKHFTIDKDLPGWDHSISADPAELEVICREGKSVFRGLGSSSRRITDAELDKRKAMRRRVVLAGAVAAGQAITLQDLDFKRPGTGINPDEYEYLIGRRAARSLEPDHELEWTDLIG